MHFDDEENFLGGELIEDPAVIVQHNYWRDAAWRLAVRRDDFATMADMTSSARDDGEVGAAGGPRQQPRRGLCGCQPGQNLRSSLTSCAVGASTLLGLVPLLSGELM